jgi:hypothetical protein
MLLFGDEAFTKQRLPERQVLRRGLLNRQTPADLLPVAVAEAQNDLGEAIVFDVTQRPPPGQEIVVRRACPDFTVPR